jgi:maltooligosyltrehalose trehalohydrolase
MDDRPFRRRYPVGAEPTSEGTHVRVWAPGHQSVEIVYGDGQGDRLASSAPLTSEANGYFAATVRDLALGGRYAFRLDDDAKPYPDPASRFQPDGPHGPSEVVDGGTFAWTDAGWKGSGPLGQVIYELHIGTFTPEGTYAAASERLAALHDLGVTLIEVMPVAEFAGRFGWGYDGVDLWAPHRNYGRPDDLRRFVDAVHGAGMGVILDVVYNHLGPAGNYLGAFAPEYFTDRYQNEWGASLNFDGDGARPVREFFIENAGYWIEEFHFDGLRLDATQSIIDASPTHVIAEIADRVRVAARGRATYVVAENEPQEARLARPAERGGYGLDALWNDDYHHSALVALTGHTEAYYTDYRGDPQELLSALRWGFLYQGQRYLWQKKRRGACALDLNASNFVVYLENHDQVANSGTGARLATTVAPADLRAMTALTLLAPGTPMLFQGQEWGSTRPFLFFADHEGELGRQVAEGRRQFLRQFPSLAAKDSQAHIPEPGAEETFRSCQLDWGERTRHDPIWQLHRDLLALRRDDHVLRRQHSQGTFGAILGPRTLMMRYFAGETGDDAGCVGGDRLLLVSLDTDRPLQPAPEPLLAPQAGCAWQVLWSSEDVRYGGAGTPPIETEDEGWRIPGHAAVLMVSRTKRD